MDIRKFQTLSFLLKYYFMTVSFLNHKIGCLIDFLLKVNCCFFFFFSSVYFTCQRYKSNKYFFCLALFLILPFLLNNIFLLFNIFFIFKRLFSLYYLLYLYFVRYSRMFFFTGYSYKQIEISSNLYIKSFAQYNEITATLINIMIKLVILA